MTLLDCVWADSDTIPRKNFRFYRELLINQQMLWVTQISTGVPLIQYTNKNKKHWLTKFATTDNTSGHMNSFTLFFVKKSVTMHVLLMHFYFMENGKGFSWYYKQFFKLQVSMLLKISFYGTMILDSHKMHKPCYLVWKSMFGFVQKYKYFKCQLKLSLHMMTFRCLCRICRIFNWF